MPVEEKEVEEEEALKQSLLKRSEISVMLDTYDDIFSDFDPRVYSQRALSDDFLLEAKKATLDKEGDFQLQFLIPKVQRRVEHESLIRRRLREHFRKHFLLLEREVTKTKRKGIFMALGGALMLLLAMLISTYWEGYAWLKVLLVLLEPAGWFTAWTGLDEIYYTAEQKRPDLEFYRKMSDVEIVFVSY